MERIAGLAQKSAAAAGEMGGIAAGETGQCGATALADEAGFEIDRNRRVGPFEQELDFAQEGHVGRTMEGGACRWRRVSARSLRASRTRRNSPPSCSKTACRSVLFACGCRATAR